MIRRGGTMTEDNVRAADRGVHVAGNIGGGSPASMVDFRAFRFSFRAV